MQWSETEPIEPVPKPKTLTCKLTVWGLTLGINLAPWLLGVWGYLSVHWTIGIGVVLFGYLIAGIVTSKMRQLSVPMDQREISFSVYEVSCWFAHRYLICDR